MKPVIGVTACRKMIDPHFFYVAGEKYVRALVETADAVPLLIPPLGDDIHFRDIASRVDGLLFTGSPSNVEPHHYGGSESKVDTLHDPHRDATTLPMIRSALAAGLPLLAICRGFQEMNVALGGTLHQEVHNVAGYDVHKEDPEHPIEVQYGPRHRVCFTRGGMLHGLTGVEETMVNSLHSQGVEVLAQGVDVEAAAEDGLVEAFSVQDTESFALAVQWHPEWQASENAVSRSIFQGFGESCRDYGRRRG